MGHVFAYESLSVVNNKSKPVISKVTGLINSVTGENFDLIIRLRKKPIEMEVVAYRLVFWMAVKVNVKVQT